MMREFSKKKLGLAVMAGLGLTAAASTANAALITFKLVPTSSTTVSNAGDVVTYNVIASVENTNGNNADDGFTRAHFANVSTEAAGAAGAIGNLASLTLNSTQANGTSGVVDASVSQAGTVKNLDGNPDLEVGNNDNTVSADWIVANSGTSVKFGSGTTTNPTDFLLGTGSWTYSGGSNGGATSNIGYSMRVSPSNLALGKTVVFVEDGVTYSLKGDGTGQAGGAIATQGFTVTVNAVPEPTSLGLLGLGAMGLLARRRRNA